VSATASGELAAVLAGPSFNSNPHAIPGVSNLQTVIGYTAWGATALCLIGLIAAGAVMAVSYHHGSNEHMGKLGSVVAGCLIVGAAAPIAGSLLGFNLFTAHPEAVPGLTEVQTVIGYCAWVAAAICLIGLIVAGGTMGLNYRRGNVEVGSRLGQVAAGCLIVGSASTLVGAFI
jgi:hypothetical protein